MEPGTAQDLVNDAKRLGHDMTTRAITDWVAKGLLDRPTRQSLGRGKGSAPGLFPPAQRELFTLLLTKRGDAAGLSHLLVIPIAIWLYWGDDFVPTRQARRALVAWAKAYDKAPATRSRANVDALIAQIAAEDANPTDVTRLRRLLTDASIGRGFDDNLAVTLRRVADPNSSGRPLLRGYAVDHEGLVRAWIMDSAVRSALVNDRVNAAVLEKARIEVRNSRKEYEVLHALTQAVSGSPIEGLGSQALAELVESAARDLMLPLYALLTDRHR